MDSVSQFALGAAVAATAMGDRTKAWRAVVWGGVIATLPDLDVLIDHGDAVQNMIRHRSESHALFWLTLATPFFAFVIAALHGERRHVGRWALAVWLALVTHPLLDAMTIYGTRLWLPFDATPVGLGSVFVIDPLYTVPLLVGTAAFLRSGRLRWNTAGLVLSALYLAWSAAAQTSALAAARASLQHEGIAATDVLATPAPFQTLLWRLVAHDEQRVYEAYWSVLDDSTPIEWTSTDRGAALRDSLRGAPAVDDLAAFSHGFWKAWRDGDRVLMADVRMGMEPWYVFTFAVGEGAVAPRPLTPRDRVGVRIDAARALPWLWRRMQGERVPQPR